MGITIYLEEAAQVSVVFYHWRCYWPRKGIQSKPAGFRTMILISVGACLYTILSKERKRRKLDRIASNIVTGIGFIGAGSVIFKEGISVERLTTAALDLDNSSTHAWRSAITTTPVANCCYHYGGYCIIRTWTCTKIHQWFLQGKDYKIRDVG